MLVPNTLYDVKLVNGPPYKCVYKSRYLSVSMIPHRQLFPTRLMPRGKKLYRKKLDFSIDE